MSQPTQRWTRAEKLDAERMAHALYDQTGIALAVEGPCPGGQVGASYVRRPNGRRSVLTVAAGPLADLRAGPLAVVDALRAIGYPAPATEIAVQVDAGVVIVQELLPGVQIDRLDQRGLRQALALNRLQAGILADHHDIPLAKLYLDSDGPGFCLHEPLRQHNRRTAALERRIAAVAHDCPDYLVGNDAMHMDFHPGNMLTDGEVITGVVDWDAASRGDRHFDLVTLRFGIHADRPDDDVVRELDAVLDAVPEEVLRPAWAGMSLRMTDWAIRHFSPDDVEHWLDLAEQRVW
ncbi:MAG TPA: aminoglycoside phosphotransferase family protein [Pseudonocardiaceae bacterium]